MHGPMLGVVISVSLAFAAHACAQRTAESSRGIDLIDYCSEEALSMRADLLQTKIEKLSQSKEMPPIPGLPTASPRAAPMTPGADEQVETEKLPQSEEMIPIPPLPRAPPRAAARTAGALLQPETGKLSQSEREPPPLPMAAPRAAPRNSGADEQGGSQFRWTLKSQGGGSRKWDEKNSIDSISPIYFFHVPKSAGSQFAASLLLFDQVCWNMTADARRQLVSGISAADHGELDDQIPDGHEFKYSQYWEDICFVADMRSFGYYFGDHSGIGSAYSTYVPGHGLTMLRQPEQRIMSGFLDLWHSWPLHISGKQPHDELEYAKVVAGCAVKMLTRDGASYNGGHTSTVCGDPTPATDGETKLAIERLAEGFVFVGIVEEWTKSMCLFHAMFGGKCTDQELGTINAGNNSSSSEYDLSALKGWTDVPDGKLYEEGLRLFNNNLQCFEIATQSCCETFH